MSASTASQPTAIDRANRRLVTGLLLSMALHALLLLLQFGVPALGPSAMEPLRLVLDLARAPEPVPPAPAVPDSAAAGAQAPAVAAAPAAPVANGFHLVAPRLHPTPPMSAAPKRRPVRRTRAKSTHHARLHERVIVQDHPVESTFAVPLPEMAAAPETSADPMAAQDGAEDGQGTAVAKAEQPRARDDASAAVQSSAVDDAPAARPIPMPQQREVAEEAAVGEQERQLVKQAQLRIEQERKAQEEARQLAEVQAQREIDEGQARQQAETERSRLEAQAGQADARSDAQAERQHTEQLEIARREQEEAARRASELAERQLAEQLVRQASAEEQATRREAAALAIRQAEAAQRQAAEEIARQQAEQARQRAAEELARQQDEQARQRAAEALAIRQAEEAKQRSAEELARQQAQQTEQARQRAAEELARQQAEQARQRAAEALAVRQAEAARQRAAEELARQRAEQARQGAAEELARQQAEQARRRAADELARQQAELVRQREADEFARQQAAQGRQRASDELARQQPEQTSLRQVAAARAAGQAAQPESVLANGPGTGTELGRSRSGASAERGPSSEALASRARQLLRGLDILKGAPPVAARVDEPQRADRRVVASGTERDLSLRFYVDSFRQKIERNGTLNRAQLSAQRVRIDPVVSVALRSDGSVADVLILRSSGHPETDEAVRRIVRLNERFAAFPPNVAARFDVIEIRRIWVFAEGLKLLEEVR